MQFEDPKKKYEIEFTGIGKINGHSTPMFKLTLFKPVKAESGFDINDIKTERGVTGIKFSKYSEIAKAYKFKGDVLSSMLPEALDYIRKTHDEELGKIKESAQKDPETWRWWTGCDTGNLYISPNSETGWEFRPDLEEIKNTLEKVHKFHAYDLFGKEEETNLVSHETVMKIYNEILEANAKRQAERNAAKEAKETPIFKKARETGEPQIIESYPVECEDPREECDTDIVTIYAMPDGTTKRTQNHTW